MAPIKFTSALVSLGLLFSTPALTQSTGCGKNPTLTNGTNTINGREYILNIPTGYDSSTQHSLIFGFHWRGGNMNDVAKGTGIEPWYGLATRAGGSAIFVSPNGLNNGWGNAGGEDVKFVDSIIEAVEADLCVDQGKRFATGFSFGGGMSYALACARAAKFRAVSVLAGGLISGCDGGKDPIAYLGIHGINDGVLGISGGIDIVNKFAGNNGCQKSDIGRPATNSRSSVRTDFKGCSKPVSFIAFDGGHDGAPLGVGNPLAPDATWKFFTDAAGGTSGTKEPSTSAASAAETVLAEASTPLPTFAATSTPAATTTSSVAVPTGTADPSTEVPCDGTEDDEAQKDEEEAPCDGEEEQEAEAEAPCDGEEEEEEEEGNSQEEQPCA